MADLAQNTQEPQTLEEWRAAYLVIYKQRNNLIKALRPFAEQAEVLNKWQGGPPTPAHAFHPEIMIARQVLEEIGA